MAKDLRLILQIRNDKSKEGNCVSLLTCHVKFTTDRYQRLADLKLNGQ